MEMKTTPLWYRRIAAVCMFLFFAAGRTQTVIRVMNGYVLLDSDRGLGKAGDEIAVERITDGGNVETGRIRIMLLRENKASGKIVVEPEPYRIEVGDVVRMVETRPLSKEKRFAVVEVVSKAKGTGKKEEAK